MFKTWNDRLSALLDSYKGNQRCFSRSLKEEMFKNSNVCGLCNQKINSIDESQLDHKTQYWRGGLTVPENARLVHSVCNNKRSRKDEA